MAVKFETMDKSDYIALGKEVKDTFSKDPYSMLEVGLSSGTIFGRRQKTSEFKHSAERDHVRAYIKLEGSIVNKLLAQKDASLLAKILGVDREEAKMVSLFQLVYSKTEDRLVYAEEAKSVDDILCGAEVFRKWIDEFDLDEAIEDAYNKLFLREGGIVASYTKGSGEFRLAGDWYADVKAYSEAALKMKHILVSCFNTKDSRLSFLLNMTSKKNLYGCCMDYITVVPIGMRPDIGERRDPLSKLYADIISANNGLKLTKVGKLGVKEYTTLYAKLDKAVDRLLTTETPGHPQRKPIIERVSGKEGFIRGHMYGKRTDYSGRSVITINPEMSIRNIGVPKKMLTRLFRHHILKRRKDPDVTRVLSHENENKLCNQFVSGNILNEVPVLTGRQPTLHRISMQAYKALPVDSRSIQINPLAVTAFNADFDGDQMWLRVPCSDSAVKEVRNLFLTDRNMFAPDNGEIIVMPRHEIIYGLNVCTREHSTVKSSGMSFPTNTEMLKALYNQDIKVYDTVTCEGKTDTAGRLAVMHCLKPYEPNQLEEINVQVIKRYVKDLSELGIDVMIDAIDRLVELGFKISGLYPPTIRLLDDADISELYKDFYEKVEKTMSWYERGYEEEETFNMLFDDLYTEMDNKIKEHIIEYVGEENGITRMAESGARGSKSNMVQIYAHKGRVQDNDNSAFRSIITSSYVDQLTPLEHFVTAFGGRHGLITKNIGTSDTGYFARQLWHACQPIVISNGDCGTKNGFVISKAHIARNYANKETVDDIFINMIAGRYSAEDGSFINEKRARLLCAQKQEIKIRSPLTCDKPCCRKCYGEDPATHDTVAIGAPVGLVAAQSIGRIGTQLSMDVFKKGGVASRGSVVSTFKKVTSLANMREIKKSSTYDPVAWESGEIRESINSSGGQKRVSIKGSRKSIQVPSNAILKDVAVKGEGMCIERGDYDMNELLEYAGMNSALSYLIHELYSIYRDETEINLKHFEVLALSMTMALVIDTDRKDLKLGVFHDVVQLKNGPLDNTEYYLTLKSVKEIQNLRPMALSTIAMERVKEGLARSIFMELEDPLRYPLNRVLLGLSTKQGTHYPGYIESSRR